MDERTEVVERLYGEIDRVSSEYKVLAAKYKSEPDEVEVVLNVLERLKTWAAGEKCEKGEFLKKLIEKIDKLGWEYETNENVLSTTEEILEWAKEERD